MKPSTRDRRSRSRGLTTVELRIGDELFAQIRQYTEDWQHGERGAFLLCGHAKAGAADVLLARAWEPVPASQHNHSGGGGAYGLEWSPQFSAQVLAKADRAGAALVFVHSHGASTRPALSATDRESAAALFPGFSRVLGGKPSGSVVLGASAAAGTFWQDGAVYAELSGIKVVGAPLQVWRPAAHSTTRAQSKRRHARMLLAIGPESEVKLASASVAVIGLCGGGSHVVQQLAHMGVGRLVLIDHDVVEDVNLGRMVGSRPSDATSRVLKTRAMARMVRSIDPDISIQSHPHPFPDRWTLAA